MDISFLKSNRFWALVVFAVVTGLASVGIITPEVATPILTILAGHIGIKTIDRFAEKSGSVDTK